MDHWIWLPEADHPDKQKTKLSCMLPGEDTYAVCELERTFDFGGRRVKDVKLTVSGDTAFLLFVNGDKLLRGPASVGGDFLYNEILRPEYYAYRVTYTPESPAAALHFTALVRMGSVRICEYSRGQGGFLLQAEAVFTDGGSEILYSDESWRIRVLPAYTAPYRYNGALAAGAFLNAETKPSPVSTAIAPIPPCEEHILPLEDGGTVCAGKGTVTKAFTLDRIYACYLHLRHTGAAARVTVTGAELPHGADWSCTLAFEGNGEYYGMELLSVGELRVELTGEGACSVTAELLASCYPAPVCCKTETSDTALNRVLEVCAHSLKYCRQTHHLDSPRHCEPLACTGDYYIETLMTAFTFGDMRLAAFDVRRTANLLRQHDGEMFHTSYSLIWVQMLWDVYRLTGDPGILAENADALGLLLRRFAGYVGENGLIETPPNYMFIDWLNPDGINLHHPPKALGQTCMCLFYYGALQTAEKIYRTLGNRLQAEDARAKAAALHSAVIGLLWDGERQLFFEGLNTPTEERLIYNYMPQNVQKRYYRRHANILAAYFGFFAPEENRALLRRVLQAEDLGEVQPYFQHFLLDAVYRCGLREEYTLPLLEQWKPFIEECPKGLPEGFFKPTPSYTFDRSHAWGGTPAYALPLAVTGLKMIEPGFRKIRLSPSSLGLDCARAEAYTPYGILRVTAYKDRPPVIEAPSEIEIEML